MNIYYTQQQINCYIHNIVRQLWQDNFKPDYIVGLARGGLVPAVQLSHYLKIPMHSLQVSLHDGGSTDSNCWMSEDAFGYVPLEFKETIKSTFDPSFRKNILIVDDINDSGATFNWVKQDWMSSCLPDNSAWNAVWHKTVRFAALINNEASDFKDVDYIGKSINKVESPEWCVFPWENWWS